MHEHEFSILVPLDGSRSAELALDLIPALKGLGNLHVRLANFVEQADEEDEYRLMKRCSASASYLAAVAKRTESRYSVPVEQISELGTAFVEILAEASKLDVSLVVMSTHGASLAEPTRLGSVTDKVVRGVECPVLLIGPRASVPLRVERITVPLDGSGLAAEVLPLARQLAEKLGSNLRLIRVVQPPAALETEAIGSLAVNVIESQRLMASLYLEEVRLELETSQPVETEVLEGPPAEAILRDLDQNRADLVVMSTHGRHGFIRWALGSVTDRVIRGDVPVLVLRPADIFPSSLT
jgi:nucleotide-binding universal stress UspA family protein